MLKGLAHTLGNARHDDFHLVRTAREWASVFSVEGPHGETVRVLDVGGAYQSATYLGNGATNPSSNTIAASMPPSPAASPCVAR